MVRKLRGHVTQIADDIFVVKTWIANVVFIGEPGKKWVLVDAGIRISAHQIRRESERLYGKNAAPQAILLTHGHFDHVGALDELLENWNVPVYAHTSELPFLTGREKYPPPDPGGGLISFLSPFFPRNPIDLGIRVGELARDNTIAELPGWEWIFTPGHTPGHVAYFRKADRILLAGDAIITTRQESAFSVVTQKKEIKGPPAYFTPDWYAAWDSTLLLEALEPRMMVSGHGHAMEGEALRQGLRLTAGEFGLREIPRSGRYTPEKFNGPASSRIP